MNVTELWRLIVSQANDKIHNIGTVKNKPNMIPRWPPESIRLAKECERLTRELERHKQICPLVDIRWVPPNGQLRGKCDE